MEILYHSKKKQCTSLKEAKKLFGGDVMLSTSLLARINALESADTIKDIIVQPQFYFHSLLDTKQRKLKGYFSIAVKTKRDAWRIILQPLNDTKKPYDPCNIDEICDVVRIIEIKEVSKHYE